MTDYALTSLQPTAQQVTVSHGLLNSPDLLGWLFTAFLIAAGMFIMLPAARESAKALWAPVGRWLAGLSALSALIEGLCGLTCCLCVLRPVRWDNFPEDEDGQYREQLRRLAYRGFPERLQT